MSLPSRHIAFFIAFLITLVCQAQVYNTTVEAKINLEPNSEFTTIIGTAYNKSDINQSLRYELTVFKTNPQNSNTSKNSQSGRIVLEPGVKKNLSQTTINSDVEDRMIILLLIYDEGDKPLGKDRIIINGNAADKRMASLDKNTTVIEEEPIPTGDGVKLRGLVLEETKSRPGREFFTTFSGLYREANIDGELVITVKESLSLANNTAIEIIVGNEKIFEFIVRPQNDYLKAAAQAAVARVGAYFKYLEENKSVVKQY